jgi:Holliday junction resolvase RusA-like endonuclease
VIRFFVGDVAPSVNHYWQQTVIRGHSARRISKAGLAFRESFLLHLLESLDLQRLIAHVPRLKSSTKRDERERAEADMRYLLRRDGLPHIEGPARLTLGIRGDLMADGSEPAIGSPKRPDLDNLPKAIQDCLQHFGLLDDDNQIDELIVRREPPDEKRTTVTLRGYGREGDRPDFGEPAGSGERKRREVKP